MVNSALIKLGEKNGSSVRAIKKYIITNYLVDIEKLTPFIKRYLSKAVDEKILVQATGKGFTGSFKLAATKTINKPTPKTPKEVTKPTTTKRTTSSITKKLTKKANGGKIKRAGTPKKIPRDGSKKTLDKKPSHVEVAIKVEKASVKAS